MSSAISTLSSSQISGLLQAEQTRLLQPISNFKSQIATDQSQISAWGKIASAVSSLDSAVNAISDPTSFDNRSATSSSDSVATATVKRNATVGTYDLTNVKLAQSQRVYSNSFASASASLGSGSGNLTFSFGSGSAETVKVSSTNMTLSGLAQAINNVSGGKVNASLVGGSSGERLVLTGNNTGSSQSFSVSGTGALSQFSYSASGGTANTMTQAVAARNATLNINGVPISNSTNTLTSAIQNGSITLAGSGSASVSVTSDASSLSQSVSSLVDKLNSAVSTVQKETAFTPGSSNGSSSGSSKGKAGPLLGNFTASDLSNQFLSAVSGLSIPGTGSSPGLSARDVGIQVSKDGAVTFDSGTFKTAYQNNPSAVESLVKQLYTNLHGITSSATSAAGNGTIDQQKASLNNDVNSLQSEITQQNKFVASQMRIYQAQFSQLESMQSSLATTSAYLSLLTGSGSGSSKG